MRSSPFTRKRYPSLTFSTHRANIAVNFLRRSVATLFEFAECHVRETLDAAIDFFGRNDALLRKVRNNVGGHFGQQAARHAIQKLPAKTFGKIELILDESGRIREPRLHFAGELAATAIGRAFPNEDLHEALKTFIGSIVLGGYQHATQSVQILIGLELLPRFG